MNIAARIVEIVSGMPYEEFLQKRFFDPLGMTETTFWPSEEQIARLAGAYGPNKEKNGYARGGIGFLTKPHSDRVHRFPEAGGGLFATTHDPPPNSIKFFATREVLELAQDRTWLAKITHAVNQHWQRKNAQKKCRPGKDSPGGPVAG